MSARTLRALVAISARAIDAAFRRDPENRRAFMAILQQPPASPTRCGA